MLFLSNDWVLWFWREYSMVIVAIPSVITGALKIIAVLTPSVKTDKIRELIENWSSKKIGGGKWLKKYEQ